MRYVVVKRVTGSLGVFLVLAAGLFAWLVRDEPPAPAAPAAQTPATPRGAALFEGQCGQCHTADDLRGPLRAGGEAKRSAWLEFLKDHAEASDEEDRLILEYLASEAAGK